MSTHHSATLQVLQRRPVVADCLVPQHALVPNLEEQPRVKVVELAAEGGKRRKIKKWNFHGNSFGAPFPRHRKLFFRESDGALATSTRKKISLSFFLRQNDEKSAAANIKFRKVFFPQRE